MPFKKGIERVEDPSRGEGAEPLPGLCRAQSEASEFSFSKKMKEHGKQQGDEKSWKKTMVLIAALLRESRALLPTAKFAREDWALPKLTRELPSPLSPSFSADH